MKHLTRLLALGIFLSLASCPSSLPAVFNYVLSTSGNIVLSPGQTGSVTITRTLVSGTAEPVLLTVSDLPPGTTATFTNNPCTPPCSSLLSIDTSPSTPTGRYTITVSGSPLNKLTSFILEVTAQPPSDSRFDYTLSASRNVTVFPGQAWTVKITNALVSGSPEAVSFAASGFPSDVHLRFSEWRCVPPCETTLTIRTYNSTPPGTYAVAVTGTPLNRVANFTFTVKPGQGPSTTRLSNLPMRMSPVGLSADGNVVVGTGRPGGTDYSQHVFRWTASGGMEDLGTLGAGTVTAVSADGNVVVGTGRPDATDYSQHVFRWTASGGMEDLGTLRGRSSWATGVSADGSVVGG